MANKGDAITTTMDVDISGLKAGIQEANRQIRLANSAFKAAASEMDFVADSADGLQRKIEQLTAVHDAENKKLENLKLQYKAVSEEQGENSTAAQNLQIKINNQQATVNKAASNLAKYEQQLADVEAAGNETADATEDQRSAYEKLQDTISAQESELASLKTQYQSVALEQGENSDAARELAGQITSLSGDLQDNKSKLDSVKASANSFDVAMSGMADSTDEVGNSFDQLKSKIDSQESELSSLKSEYANVVMEQGKNSSSAKQLASQIDSLSGELKQNKSQMNELESAADSLDNSLDDTGGGFTILKGAVAEFAGNVLTSAAGAVKDFIGSLFELSEATEEYRSMLAKISGSAESFGYSVEFAEGKYEQFYGYLGDDQMATNAITNLMGMKVSTDTVSKAADAAIGVWSAYGDSIPIEGLTESINESSRVAQVTGNLADAINWAERSNRDWSAAMSGHSAAQAAFNKAIADGESQEDAYSAALAACSDTQERADLIAQTLNQTFGKSKKTYDEMQASTIEANHAQLGLKDTQAKLGQAIEPVNTAITNLKTQALDAISPVIETVAGKFGDFLNKLSESPGAMSAVVSVVAGLATAFTVLAGAMAIQAIINGVTKAMKALNVTLAANPIMLIVTVIAALVAAFITAYTTSETFRNAVNTAFTMIKNVVTTVVTAIVNFFTVTIPGAINTVISFFANLPTNIANFLTSALTFVATWVPQMASKALEMGSKFISNVVKFFTQLPERIGYFIGFALGKIVTWVPQMAAKALEMGSKFISNVVKFFTQLPGKIATFISNALNKVKTWVPQMASKALEAGSKFLTNVVNGIKNLPSRVWSFLSNVISRAGSFVSSFARKAVEAAKNFATSLINGIKSLPSKVASIGKDIVRGIWNGITGMGGWIKDKIGGFADGLVKGFKDAVGINSPSKVFAALSKWIPAGIGVGIEDNAKAALNPVKKLSKKMTDQVKALKDAIVPEDVKASLQASVNGLKSKVAGAARSVAGTVQQTKEIVFNQYLNSPKALSRLDIYRQTKSQLFSAKRRLANV